MASEKVQSPTSECKVYYPPYASSSDARTARTAIESGETSTFCGVVSREQMQITTASNLGISVSTLQGLGILVSAGLASHKFLLKLEDLADLEAALEKTKRQATVHYFASDTTRRTPGALTVP